MKKDLVTLEGTLPVTKTKFYKFPIKTVCLLYLKIVYHKQHFF